MGSKERGHSRRKQNDLYKICEVGGMQWSSTTYINLLLPMLDVRALFTPNAYIRKTDVSGHYSLHYFTVLPGKFCCCLLKDVDVER